MFLQGDCVSLDSMAAAGIKPASFKANSSLEFQSWKTWPTVNHVIFVDYICI